VGTQGIKPKKQHSFFEHKVENKEIHEPVEHQIGNTSDCISVKLQSHIFAERRIEKINDYRYPPTCHSQKFSHAKTAELILKL